MCKKRQSLRLGSDDYMLLKDIVEADQERLNEIMTSVDSSIRTQLRRLVKDGFLSVDMHFLKPQAELEEYMKKIALNFSNMQYFLPQFARDGFINYSIDPTKSLEILNKPKKKAAYDRLIARICNHTLTFQSDVSELDHQLGINISMTFGPFKSVGLFKVKQLYRFDESSTIDDVNSYVSIYDDKDNATWWDLSLNSYFIHELEKAFKSHFMFNSLRERVKEGNVNKNILQFKYDMYKKALVNIFNFKIPKVEDQLPILMAHDNVAIRMISSMMVQIQEWMNNA